MTILFEVDPNVVKPGWTPLLILIGLALVMALLFRSMKRQFRKVHTNFPQAGRTGVEPDAGFEGRSSGPSPTVTEVTDEEHTPRR